MIIIAITDIHGNSAAIEKIAGQLERTDLVVLTGDITHFGKRKEVDPLIKQVSCYARSILAVPGNCDYAEVFQYLTEYKINLHGNAVVSNGFAFIGLGGSLPCPGHTPGEFSEEQMEELLAHAVESLDPTIPQILVSHQPPFNTKNDRVANGGHVGSKPVRSFIETYQPFACFTGHIHEAVGMDKIKDTHVINPGPLREGGYTYLEINDKNTILEIRGRRME